jgi:tRNA pseudouridine13 synthase
MRDVAERESFDMGKWLMPHTFENDFLFNPSPRDFTVEEIPLYPFSGSGEHLILKVRKKSLSTWEMLDILSSQIGLRRREIGYAGLKDKHAMTIQYISLPVSYEEKMSSFSHENIKILDMFRHDNKIRTGHLKGNRFRLRFKKVLGIQRDKIDSTLDWIEKNGLPNYFGTQRFGRDGVNWLEGRDLAIGRKKMRDRKMREFLISSYQSYLFNGWLSRRVEICRLLEDFTPEETENILSLPASTLAGARKQKSFFRILGGDLMMHYPYGRLFEAEETYDESIRMASKDISVTGLLPGRRVSRASGGAGEIEKPFDDERISERGSRRYAWIFPHSIERRYIPEKAHYELEFTLPKGSYATVVADMLRGRYGSVAEDMENRGR